MADAPLRVDHHNLDPRSVFHAACFWAAHGHGRWGLDGLHVSAPLPLPSAPNAPPLHSLLPELWGVVASFMPPLALLSFRLVCKYVAIDSVA